MDMDHLHSETIGIIGGYDQKAGARYKSFTPPLCQTVTFPLESAETARRIYDHRDPYHDYVYTRRNNPTNDIFEQRMAAMEGGEAALATSSGMAAVFSIAGYLLEAGAECVVSNRTYAKTFEVFNRTFTKFGVRVRMVNDPTNHDDWAARVNKNTRFMFVETPSNPGLVISDISKLAKIGDAHGVPLIVDNTLASPIATKPLELGAAVVIESVSKYISGNGSTLGGILVTKKDWIDEIRRTIYVQCGMTSAPFNSWLGMLGLETLGPRIKQHTENAMQVARYLQDHPKVATVNYPGLEAHPQHDLARKQMSGLYGGLLSFVLKQDKREAVYKFIDSLRVVTHAIHLSATRSIISNPPSTNYAELTEAELAAANIPMGLIRFSVGIEHIEDLLKDLDQALDRI